MRVLVTAASKHGATMEIAQTIGDVLAEHGHTVVVLPVEQVTAVDDYEACVIGSAIYLGRWRGSAKDLVRRHAEPLRSRPVWLFSSGPVGDPPRPEGDPGDTTAMVATATPREHRVFAGKLDEAQLGFLEKRIVRAIGAPYGDFRDWDTIRRWAATIAQALHGEHQRPRRSPSA
jgi:menaquinone-dependent protoporphyrinogen oxidase